MKKINYKYKKQSGYAILFTIVIVSAISVITAGLTNAAYKQLILSSLAKDSQVAFFQADTAADCALYFDAVYIVENVGTPPQDGDLWTCGGLELGLSTSDIMTSYALNPPQVDSSDPCFRIEVKKATTKDSEDNDVVNTTISARGYNICDKGNVRTVEREIYIKY
jgi:hypothetical protein